MDVMFVDSSGRLMKFGCVANGGLLEIVSYQGDNVSLTSSGIGNLAIGENFWSFQTVSSPVRANNQGVDSVMYSDVNLGTDDTSYNFDYNFKGTTGPITSNSFTTRTTTGVGPCIIPYTFSYTVAPIFNVTHFGVQYTSTSYYDLFNKLPYPFVRDPSNIIPFPALIGSYNWKTSLGLTTTISDIIFGNRMDLTTDPSFDPTVAPLYTFTSKAFMANRNQGPPTSGIYAASDIVTPNIQAIVYDTIYRNYQGRFILL